MISIRRTGDGFHPGLFSRSARRRYWSGRPMVSADRGGLYVLRDLEQDSQNPVLSPSGLISCKKGYPVGYPFAWKERETGLEPAASTLARSRSTNWATRAFLIVLCSCWTQDIIYRITLVLSIIFTQKIKVRNYTAFSENSFNSFHLDLTAYPPGENKLFSSSDWASVRSSKPPPRMSSHCYKKYAAFLPRKWLKTAYFCIEDVI